MEEGRENGGLDMGVVATRDVVTLKLDGGFQTGDSSGKRGPEDGEETGAAPEAC